MSGLRAIAGALLLLVLLAGGNFLLAEWLLGLRRDSIASLLPLEAPIAKPLVLEIHGKGPQRFAPELMNALSISPEEASRLPSAHPLLIEFSWLQRANPYPPLLSEHNPGYSGPADFLSFGYLDEASRYHQITYYAGEADTTPSLFVSKVRGDETGWGDYFTWYLCLASKSTRPEPVVVSSRGVVTQWEEPSPQLDRVLWGSYRGGSYNGFEEIEIVFVATCLEIVVVAGWALWRHRKRSRK